MSVTATAIPQWPHSFNKVSPPDNPGTRDSRHHECASNRLCLTPGEPSATEEAAAHVTVPWQTRFVAVSRPGMAWCHTLAAGRAAGPVTCFTDVSDWLVFAVAGVSDWLVFAVAEVWDRLLFAVADVCDCAAVSVARGPAPSSSTTDSARWTVTSAAAEEDSRARDCTCAAEVIRGGGAAGRAALGATSAGMLPAAGGSSDTAPLSRSRRSFSAWRRFRPQSRRILCSRRNSSRSGS
ncbi:hypothetical protein GCM10025331_20120 [Actinoplanes utahensis]|nr:hypothetical protein Aut01nite_37260 [Actinoplanes utahensis]